MKNEERINIRVVLHDMLSKPAKKLQEREERLRESAENARDAHRELGEALDEAGRHLDRHRNATEGANDANREAVRVGRRVRRSTQENTSATEENTRSTQRNTGRRRRSNDETERGDGIITRLTKRLTKSGRSMVDFGTNYLTFIGMFKSLIMTDLAPAIPILITGVTSLGAGAVAMLAPLAKLGANIAHILPLYASLGTIMGVTTMAFNGMGDAIEKLNDPTATVEEINEAMSKLGPNAQKGARALAGISKEFKVIQGAVQETFWGGGMDKAFKDFGKVFLPILGKGLVNASKHMREASKYSMKLFSGKREQKALENVLDGAGRSAGKLGVVFGELGRVLLFITESAMPVFEDFLEHIAGSLNGIGDSIDKDEMTQFFREAGEMAKGFWDGIKNIAIALRNTSKSAKPLTDYLSKGLGNVLEKWAKWTGSKEGQKSMNDFFKSMIPNFEAMGNLIGSLWDAFKELGNSEWFAPFINDIANNVIPNITKIIKALSDGLMPVFIGLSEAFTKFTEGSDITIVQPLIDIVSAVGTAFTWVFDALSNLSPEMKNFMIYMSGLSLIGIPVLGIFRSITGGVWKLIGGFKGLWKILKPVFKFIGSAFNLLWNFAKVIWNVGKAVFKGFGKAFGFIGKLLKPVFGFLGKIGKSGLGGFLKLLGFFGKRLITILGGPVGWIIGIGWLIVDAFKLAYDNIGWFKDGVDAVVGWIVEKWEGFMNFIRDVVAPGIASFVGGAIAWFANLPTNIGNFIIDMRDRFNGFVAWLVGTVVGGIANFIAGIVGWFATLPQRVNYIIEVVKMKWFLWTSWLKLVIATKVNEFVGAIVGWFATLPQRVNYIIELVKTKWFLWTSWLKITIATKIREFVNLAVDKFKAIRQGVQDVIDKVKGIWNGIVDWLKTKIIDRIASFVTDAINAFDKIGAGVGTAMDKIRDAAQKPVNFVVNTVYNNGIRKMWNKIADTFGLNTLPEVSMGGGGSGGGADARNQRGATAFATGGVLPGYSPGKDIHHFTSPTGGNLALSGGEAIMRPEFTRLVGGKSGVDALNKMAINGNLNQAFAGGGITEFAGDLGKKAGDLAGKAWGGIKDFGSWAWNGAKDIGEAIGNFVSDPVGTITNLVKKPAEAMYGDTPNAGAKFSKAMIEMPKRTISGLIDKAKSSVSGWFQPNEMEGSGSGGALGGAVHMGAPPAGGSWVRPSRGPITQRYGVPGVLSGLPHAGTDIAGGGPTYSAGDGTVYRTGSGILGGRSGLGIGISHGGGVFTYYGHNPVGGIQVRPGQKVKAGQHIGYQGSTGNVTGTHLHFELHKGGWGRNVNPSAIGVYDTGGWLMPGQTAMNMSNKPEPILNGEQFGWLRSMAMQGVAGGYEQAVTTGTGYTSVVYEGDEYNIKIIVGKDVGSPEDIGREVKKQLEKIKREKSERR